MKLYSISDAAKILGKSRQWIHNLYKQGRIRLTEVSPQIFVMEETELERLKAEWVPMLPRPGRRGKKRQK